MLGQDSPEDPVTLPPSLALSHAAPSSRRRHPSCPRQHSRRPVPDAQKSTVTLPSHVPAVSLPDAEGRGARGGRAPRAGAAGRPRQRPPPAGETAAAGPSPSSAPGLGPPQCSPRAGGLGPRRTLARSLARSLTTVTGDTMAEAAAAAGTGSGLRGYRRAGGRVRTRRGDGQ